MRALVLLLIALGLVVQDRQPFPYQRADLPVDARVRDLLSRMTLEEKFWQLFMIPGDLDNPANDYSHGIFGLQIRGAKSAKKPVIASMTLMPGVSGLETPHGVPMKKMVRAVEASEPDAVGVNCSVEAERMRAAVEELHEALALPVVAKPQAKMSDKCATGRSSESPEKFARDAAALVAAGASAVGGCCGVGPAGIAALKAALEKEAHKWAS